jgi:hypothetical protein
MAYSARSCVSVAGTLLVLAPLPPAVQDNQMCEDIAASAVTQANPTGVPPALPGRQSEFDISGSIPCQHENPKWSHVGFDAASVRMVRVPCIPQFWQLLSSGCEKAPLRGQQP